nr:SpoIIE family protein phosphatase [Streptomyces antimycoticus]
MVLLVRHTASREPFTEDDLFVTENLVARAAICMDNARRYAREPGIALALQRSLLAYRPEAQHAVDVASRYLPSESGAGVGGDWFDVIPLPCARVGLVVGDVVGHGINASAAMGRLRTAVRTLNSSPTSMTSSPTPPPKAKRTPARSPPTWAPPASTPSTTPSPDTSPSPRPATRPPPSSPPAAPSSPSTCRPADQPPLRLGSLPFEAAELEIPEGTSLVLLTDGLLEARDRDVDEGLETLRHSLEHPTAAPTPSATPPPEAPCDSILEAMLPVPRGRAQADDIALVIARTRALDENHVAQWDLTRDLAIVAEAREHASQQLTTWGVDNAVFTTELVVSELVTNAIRHATDPSQLRLIRQPHSLICEVSDGSATTPHLRRARLFDEGGRGLLLVAQLPPLGHPPPARGQNHLGRTIPLPGALTRSSSPLQAPTAAPTSGPIPARGEQTLRPACLSHGMWFSPHFLRVRIIPKKQESRQRPGVSCFPATGPRMRSSLPRNVEDPGVLEGCRGGPPYSRRAQAGRMPRSGG